MLYHMLSNAGTPMTQAVTMSTLFLLNDPAISHEAKSWYIRLLAEFIKKSELQQFVTRQ